MARSGFPFSRKASRHLPVARRQVRVSRMATGWQSLGVVISESKTKLRVEYASASPGPQGDGAIGGDQRLVVAAVDELENGQHGKGQRGLGVKLQRFAGMIIGTLARHRPGHDVVVVAAPDMHRCPGIGGERLGKRRIELRRLLVKSQRLTELRPKSRSR